MRPRRNTWRAAVVAVTCGLVTLTTPAVAEEPTPTPTGHPEAFVSIEEGPTLTDTGTAYVQLRYTCYGDPTTVDATLSAEGAKASGSGAIPCEGEVDLPVGLRLTVPQGADGFAPGLYFAEFRANIPGQASLTTDVKIEVPPTLAPVTLTADASPEEVTKDKKIMVVGSVRRGLDGDLVSLRTALEFRPDGGDYRKIKSVTSSEQGLLKTEVTARRSGSFRFRYAGNPTTAPAVSNDDHIIVRPKPKAYRHCRALTRVYEHGVGRSGAKEKGLGVTSWTVDTATYAKNQRLDRDQDGVACERT